MNLKIVIDNQKKDPNLVAYDFVLTFCKTAYGEIQPPKEHSNPTYKKYKMHIIIYICLDNVFLVDLVCSIGA